MLIVYSVEQTPRILEPLFFFYVYEEFQFQKSNPTIKEGKPFDGKIDLYSTFINIVYLVWLRLFVGNNIVLLLQGKLLLSV